MISYTHAGSGVPPLPEPPSPGTRPPTDSPEPVDYSSYGSASGFSTYYSGRYGGSGEFSGAGFGGTSGRIPDFNSEDVASISTTSSPTHQASIELTYSTAEASAMASPSHPPGEATTLVYLGVEPTTASAPTLTEPTPLSTAETSQKGTSLRVSASGQVPVQPTDAMSLPSASAVVSTSIEITPDPSRLGTSRLETNDTPQQSLGYVTVAHSEALLHSTNVPTVRASARSVSAVSTPAHLVEATSTTPLQPISPSPSEHMFTTNTWLASEVSTTSSQRTSLEQEPFEMATPLVSNGGSREYEYEYYYYYSGDDMEGQIARGTLDEYEY